jgi:hypothetical protein
VGGEAGGCSYDLEGCRCLRDDGECVGLPDLSGWTTNVQRYTGLESGEPACLAPIVAGTTAANGVTCPTCECASPSVGCQVSAALYADATCAGVPILLDFDDQSCTAVPDTMVWTAGDFAFEVTGSCVPVGQPAVATDSYVAACETPTSCDPGCLPLPESGFDERLCVARAGDLACPTGFTERHAVYASTDLCSPCGCGPVVGSACSLSLYFNNPDCTGSWSPQSGDQTCGSVGSPPPLSGKTTAGQQGSCEPSGGVPPVGGATVSYTVCCMGAS